MGFRRHLLGILNFKILRFLKISFFNLGLKGKMCGLFPCIPIFFFLRGGEGGGWGVRLKSVKKCAFVVGLKIALLLLKSVFINLGEDMSKLWRWVAARHTTCVTLFSVIT